LNQKDSLNETILHIASGTKAAGFSRFFSRIGLETKLSDQQKYQLESKNKL